MYVIYNCRDSSRKLRRAAGSFSDALGTDASSVPWGAWLAAGGSLGGQILSACARTAARCHPPGTCCSLRTAMGFRHAQDPVRSHLKRERPRFGLRGACLMLVSVNTGNGNTFRTCRLRLLKGASKIMRIASISTVHLLRVIQLWKSGAL